MPLSLDESTIWVLIRGLTDFSAILSKGSTYADAQQGCSSLKSPYLGVFGSSKTCRSTFGLRQYYESNARLE